MSLHEPIDLACERALRLIEEHLDAGPGLPPTADLAAHLASCPSCRAELELGQALRAELAMLPHFDTPAHVIDAARRRAGATDDGAPTSGRLRLRPVGRAAVAAASLAAVAVAVALMLPRHRPEPDPTPGADVARATAEARLAFALIADATARTEQELRSGVLRDRVLAVAIRGVASAITLRSRPAPDSALDPTPGTETGGPP